MLYRYEGDDTRTYPSLRLEVSPGDVVELDDAPDGRFVVVSDEPAVSDPALDKES